LGTSHALIIALLEMVSALLACTVKASWNHSLELKRPFKGLIRPKGLIMPFKGLIRPLRAL
jgi:hypothetical protein